MGWVRTGSVISLPVIRPPGSTTPDREDRLERQGGGGKRDVAGADHRLRLAVGVGGGDLQVLRLGLEAVVGPAELPAFFRDRVGIGRERDMTLDLQVGRRRAEQVSAGDVDRRRAVGNESLGGAGQRHLQSLRHEILDLDRLGADDGLVPRQRRLDPPGAARGTGAEADRLRQAARRIRIEPPPPRLDSVRPQQPERDRRRLESISHPVPDHSGDIDRLARPIDAAIGVEEGVDPLVVVTALDPPGRRDRGPGDSAPSP